MSDGKFARNCVNIGAPLAISALFTGLACLAGSYGKTAAATTLAAPAALMATLSAYGVAKRNQPMTSGARVDTSYVIDPAIF